MSNGLSTVAAYSSPAWRGRRAARAVAEAPAAASAAVNQGRVHMAEATAAGPPQPLALGALNHIARETPDLARFKRFYTEVVRARRGARGDGARLSKRIHHHASARVWLSLERWDWTRRLPPARARYHSGAIGHLGGRLGREHAVRKAEGSSRRGARANQPEGHFSTFQSHQLTALDFVADAPSIASRFQFHPCSSASGTTPAGPSSPSRAFG